MALATATYSEKQFLSALAANASCSTGSVCTATEDGMLLLDAALTLVNDRGQGTTFDYHYGYDLLQRSDVGCFNDHESFGALRNEVATLVTAMADWGVAVLEAMDDFQAAMTGQDAAMGAPEVDAKAKLMAAIWAEAVRQTQECPAGKHRL